MRVRRIVALVALLAAAACASTGPKPPQPPVPTDTFNVACIVVDALSHQPVSGALCTITGQTGITNADGYALLFHILGGRGVVQTLTVAKDGYETRAQDFTNDHDQDRPLGLTPILPADFTRDQIGAMHLGWQGCSDHLARGTFSSWVPAAYSGDDRAQAYRDQRACGNTHVFVPLSYAYLEADTLYAPEVIAGYDDAYNLAEWKGRIEEALRLGFIPVLPLACDGHSPGGNTTQPGIYSDPVGHTYGKEWCLANLPRVLGYLEDGDDHVNLRRKVGLFGGFELINYGGYSPQDWIDLHRAIRAIWPDAFIFGEIGGYTWGGDADPNFKNGPIGWWNGPGGQDVDGIIEEFNSPFAADVRVDYEQVAAAHVVADAGDRIAVGIKPENRIVFELGAGGTPRGPWYVIAGEIASYDWARRGAAMLDVLNAKRAELRSLRFPIVN
jgi:hypothetical protein